MALFSATTALAWSGPAEERIGRKAAALAPPDLRVLILKYESDFLRGVREAAEHQNDAAHRDRSATGRSPLQREIDQQIEAAVRSVQERQPLRDLVYRLGWITHLIAEVNSPLRVGPSNLSAVERDYERYFERSLSKFPTVFYGLQEGLDVRRTLDAAVSRSRRFNALLDEEYHREGRRRSSSEFDDRSTAFGIASVSYSRAVSDAVNVYFHVWNRAGGDVRSAGILKKGNLLLNPNVR